MTSKEIMWERMDWFEDDELENELNEDEDDKFKDGYEDGPPGIMKIMGSMRDNNVVHTPFGPIQMSDVSSPIHNTAFYVGHINFNLSKKVIMAINNVEGVEFLKIMSRYRFLIGVGLMFQPRNIQRKIEMALEIPPSNKFDYDEDEDLDEYERNTPMDVQTAIDVVLSVVNKDSKWLAYILPNGEHIIKVANNDEEFASKKEEFEKLASLSHGHIMCYND
jgi:hypothetical protein